MVVTFETASVSEVMTSPAVSLSDSAAVVDSSSFSVFSPVVPSSAGAVDSEAGSVSGAVEISLSGTEVRSNSLLKASSSKSALVVDSFYSTSEGAPPVQAARDERAITAPQHAAIILTALFFISILSNHIASAQNNSIKE